MYKIIATSICFFILSIHLEGQEENKIAGNKEEITVDFLTSYYSQDGDNAAVTGGVGTEQLQDFASMLIVNIPKDSIHAFSILVGADAYSSASTDNIDNNVSSASRQDVRTYANLGYTKRNLKKGEIYGVRAGFSAEYDYTSFSVGGSYTKIFNDGNSEINLAGQVFMDNWQLIYPVELREQTQLDQSRRQSYNFQATFSQVLTKRLQMSVSGELIYMQGLLSTPFHRVYFSDQVLPDIERLPDNRLKIPLGIRFNYFPFDRVVLRSYYRYYTDDFGIDAHTASLEIPVKVNDNWTVAPFFRYHTQTGSKYFAPFATHLSNEAFYTSDYDLSELNSQKYGMALRYAPVYEMGKFKVPFSNKHFGIKALSFRGAYYTRSTGLNAFIFSVNLSMIIK